MKTLIVLAVLTVAVEIPAYLIKIPTSSTSPPNTAPGGWVHLQKLILPLFENVCEASSDPLIVSLAQSFILDSSNEDFRKPDVLTNIQVLISGKGLLAKNEIFTEYNASHLHELQTIYEVLFYANNFDVFYKAAAWARQNLNCRLYVDAIYLAIQNRVDTERLSVPAPYELLPNYFIQKDVIIEATLISAGVNITPSESVHIDGNAYTLDANYTASYINNDDESKLAYFREDIGLNSYYFLRKLKLAPWINTDINGRYGENLYQMMKQFMARYNLERYANGLPELDSFSWNALSDTPYDPKLIYANGNEFIHRTLPIELPDNEDVALLQTIENNIETVVSHMRYTGYNKTQILNHLMEILVTGDRSYETLARQLLGKDRTDSGCPSVLEHYMTSLRDPIFWKINKKIVDMVNNALKLVPTYSRNELYFPGVEIVNIEVKKIMTNFDYFEFDVTDALKSAGDNTTFQVKISQSRINHKPFTIKLNVSSIVSQKGLVKIYLGPKMLPGEFAKKKNLFTMVDSYEVNLKTGANIILRSSEEMKHFADDFLSLRTLHKQVEDAEFGLDSLPLKNIQSQMGYPSRLILPKGSPQGLQLQLFVFIAPFSKHIFNELYSLTSVEFNTAILSPGYPLDLSIEDKQLFELPNAMVKDFIVTHKGDSKSGYDGGFGGTKKWYGGNTYDSISRVDYSANKRTEPFDYSSKIDQYSRKEDYETNSNIHDEEPDTDPIEKDDIPYRSLGSSVYDYKSMNKKYEKKFDYSSKRKDQENKEAANHSDSILVDNNTTEQVMNEMKNIKDEALDSDIPLHDNDDDLISYNNYNLEPIAKITAPKKPYYTMYDYIIHALKHNDSSEENVYE